jgi:hypothetical protein
MALGQDLLKRYDMILKEDKIFIINGYLKSLDAQKIMLNDRITSELNQEEVAEINYSIQTIDEQIQAIEFEKIKIEEGE